MKISRIKECLEGYDEHKGYGRTIKDEPHIAELRQFYEKVQHQDRELSSEEQFQVVKICLGKNTWNDSESSKALEGLLEQLGGKEALQKLKDNKRLTATTVDLMAKSSHPHVLSDLITILKDTFSGTSLLELMKYINLPTIRSRLKDIESLTKERLAYQETILGVMHSEAPTTLASTIILLAKHGVDHEIWKILPYSSAIIPIFNILTLFEKSDPSLIKAHIKTLCRLKEDNSKLFAILDELSQAKITFTQIDKLLSPHVLEGSEWLRSTLKIFREAGWNIDRNLDCLLEASEASRLKISIAVEKLKGYKLSSDTSQIILDAVFKAPDYYQDLLKVEANLPAELMSEENLKIIFKAPQYADRIAKAIKRLNDMQLKDKETREVLSQHPEYADSLADLFKQLDKVGQYNAKIRAQAVESPKNAVVAAGIVRYLRLYAILPPVEGLSTNNAVEQKDSFCEILFTKNLMNLEFQDLLTELNMVGILNAENVKKIIDHSAYIRTISNACFCLSHGKKLDQNNFDFLFENPRRALAIAELLKGKPRQLDSSEEQEKGAKDFIKIRQVARILKDGFREHAFFPPAKIGSRQQIETFCKLSGQDPSVFEPALQLEKQKDILCKIAAMCGNGYLETSTEESIAADYLKI